MNFLDLVGNKRIENVALEAMKKYGVGSCGPRGFYGTFDAHLEFEKDMREYLGVEDVIMYSYGFSTIASAIPSYSKRNDIIFADSCVNQSIRQGLIASRSKIYFFTHNNLSVLEAQLEQQKKLEIRDPKWAQSTRKFVVVEGVYRETGNICDLKRLIDLKYRYKFRIFLDESLSMGILGETGKGACEYHGVDINNVDMISGSLENAYANYGGFCAGSKFLIDHQRLSGSAYCFSASSPPMLAVAMSETLRILKSERGLRQKKLQEISIYFNQFFDKLKRFKTISHAHSPIKYIVHCNHDKDILEEVIRDLRANNIMTLLVNHSKGSDETKTVHSLRVCLSCHHTLDDIDQLFSVLMEHDSYDE